MIPKIIHYCWFSNPPNYPEDVQKCINSWKEQMPDYEIKLWNADNFDININAYVKEAYTEGKYAFASDYLRLWVLYNYGGIYLDSDIEVFKSFDPLLDNRGFTCFESLKSVAPWLMASEPGNPLFKEFMDDYNERHFITEDGRYDLTPNPMPITKRLVQKGLVMNNKEQDLGDIRVYPQTYFCPFTPGKPEQDCFTANTYAMHYFNGAWKKEKSKRELEYAEKEAWYIKWFGAKKGPTICKNVNIIQKTGLMGWLRHRYNKKFNEHE